MFLRKSHKSTLKRKKEELQFKRRSIALLNYLQKLFTAASIGSQYIPPNIIDHITPYLDFQSLVNFSLANKNTYEYIQIRNTELWRSYLELIGLFNPSEYEQLKASHASLTEYDFFRMNHKAFLPNSQKLNPLCVYPNLLNAEPLKIVYNPSLYKFQFKLIFEALYPLYSQLINSGLQFSHTGFIRQFNNPKDQLILLSSFLRFGAFQRLQLSPSQYSLNYQNLQSILEFFENACLREIELGYDASDFSGKVRYYTNILLSLDDGLINSNLVNFFLQKLDLSSLTDDSEQYFTLSGATYVLDSEMLNSYFLRLAKLLNTQIDIVDQIFSDDKIQLILKIFEEVIQNYILEFTAHLSERSRTLETVNEAVPINGYISSERGLVAVLPTVYTGIVELINTQVKDSKNGGALFKQNLVSLVNMHMTPLIGEYLTDEVNFFTRATEANIQKWEAATREEESRQEADIWKNVKQEPTNKNTSFMKLDLVRGFRTLLKPINMTFEGMVGKNPTEPASVEENDDSAEFDAKVQIMNAQLQQIKSFFSLDLSVRTMANARAAMLRMLVFMDEVFRMGQDASEAPHNKELVNMCRVSMEDVFIKTVQMLGEDHVHVGFTKAIQRLRAYDPQDGSDAGVQPLVVFTELVNTGDLIQNLVQVFYNEELVHKGVVNKNTDFLLKVTQAKKKFELMLDDSVAEGLNIGIDALINKIQHIYDTYQNPKDFLPEGQEPAFSGPTDCARCTIDVLSNHVRLLVGSTEKSTIDVFQQEVSTRFFALIVKNLKTLKINTAGAMVLICDLNYYYDFIVTLKQKTILPYFIGLKTVGQIYLIDGKDAKLIGKTISDLQRFNGIFQQEEIYELVQCRADWVKVKKEVEKEMFGMLECIIM